VWKLYARRFLTAPCPITIRPRMGICLLEGLLMNSHVPLRDFIRKLKKEGRRCTLLGVGPVSPIVVRAAFDACKKYSCPAIFIASRNQVDLKSLGHGYLMGGMDQPSFVQLLNRVRREVGYAGPVYICRDHGGPWQRDAELGEKYPHERAMAIAAESFRADIEAGFNYLHIDVTKCSLPLDGGFVALLRAGPPRLGKRSC